jgi:hypothetical protein
MNVFKFPRAAIAFTLGLAGLGAIGDAVAETLTVLPNGTLTASTAAHTTVNQLNVGADGAGFNFSGATGSFTPAASANNYFYAAYVIQTTSAIAQSITTTLNNTTGVTGLSERIYAFNGSFLGDNAAGPDIIQKWSSDISVGGASISIISPVDLSAGQYVVEIRGHSVGNFGGSLAVSPVPEPAQSALLLAGLGLLGAVAARRRTSK